MRLMKFCALLVIFFTGSQAGADTSANADTESLVITAAFDGQMLSPQSQLELRLNRPAQPSEGALAVFVGSTDVTGLLETTSTRLLYRPWPNPLPAGETKVTVYLITPNREWKQIAQFTLRVTGEAAAAQAQPPDQTQAPIGTPSEPTPQAAPAQSGFAIIPSLAIAAKSQPGSWYAPATSRPARTTFSDYTLQGSLKTNIERKAFGMQSQFDVVGSSYRPEALRYGILGDEDNNGNKDSRRDDRTLRFGFFANWRPTGRMTLTANFSNTGMRSFGDLSLASSSRNMQFDAQWSWRFLGKKNAEQEQAVRFLGKLQGQWYVRYSHRYARSRNELQKLYGFNRGNTLNTGLSFTFF